jgi:hypothetical protein
MGYNPYAPPEFGHNGATYYPPPTFPAYGYAPGGQFPDPNNTYVSRRSSVLWPSQLTDRTRDAHDVQLSGTRSGDHRCVGADVPDARAR